MSTPGSRCKPSANKIVETLTFTTGKMEIRGKVSFYEHVLNRQLHVYNKPKRKEKKKARFPTHLSEG